MRAPRPRPSKANDFIWDLLTFERLMTGPITHLIYWAGLAIVAIVGFGIAGSAIGLLIRDFSIVGFMLAVPVFVVGLLVTAALAMIWRGVCEFYMAVFRIADDLRALRLAQEAANQAATPARTVAPPATSPVADGIEL